MDTEVAHTRARVLCCGTGRYITESHLKGFESVRYKHTALAGGHSWPTRARSHGTAHGYDHFVYLHVS